MCGHPVLTDGHAYVGTVETDGDDLSPLREQYDEWDHEGRCSSKSKRHAEAG